MILLGKTGVDHVDQAICDEPETLREEQPALNTGLLCSTPESRPGTSEPYVYYGPEPLPEWMALNVSAELSPAERLRQRDNSYSMRLPIEYPSEDDDVMEPNKTKAHESDMEAECTSPDLDDTGMLDEDYFRVEPPSPRFKRDTPVVWPTWTRTSGESCSKTPPRARDVATPVLEQIMEIPNCDLKEKLVQVIGWTGLDNKKELITLKISDGSVWTDCRIAEGYRIWIAGDMLRLNYLIKILEFTGSPGKDLVLVSIIGS